MTEEDLKKYPHFDAIISCAQAIKIATDPVRVAQHKFFPFMLFEKQYKPFSKKGKLSKLKVRPIRYAARADAYIYSYYRHLISEQYEKEIQRLCLYNEVIAYRRIVSPNGKSGKNNVDFACEIIQEIRKLKNCCVVALDISSFFESIDHSRLKAIWCRLLDVDNLPVDHFKVFKNITNYAVVDKIQLYERLGHFGPKHHLLTSDPVPGYLTHYKKIPKRLCSAYEFRQKVAGGDGTPSLIRKNLKNYGIPQGSPISDLLANMYMIEFDLRMKIIAENLGGIYRRYSDDILFVSPGDGEIGNMLASIASYRIKKLGNKLKVKAAKTQVFEFQESAEKQSFRLCTSGKGKNGFEYLGFRFDGKAVYVRNSTLSNLQRKISYSAKRSARAFAQSNPSMNAKQLSEAFNYELFEKRFGKVENWYSSKSDIRNWTFRTYINKCIVAFGETGKPILRQFRNQKKFIRLQVNNNLSRYALK